MYKIFEEDCNVTSPWLLRFVFDKEKMYHLGINMQDIYYKIKKHYDEYIECYFSDDNSDELIFRIKLINNEKNNLIDENDIITELKALEQNIIENIIIKGVEGIKKVILLEDKDSKYDSKNGVFENNEEWYMETNGNNLLEILIQKNDYKIYTLNEVDKKK